MVNPTIFFNIAANSKPLGHVSFELFVDKVPKTAEYFYALTTGEKGFGYKGSCFHRIIPGFMCQGGDFIHHNSGIGGKSIYGKKFNDENFILKNTGPGTLSIPNAVPNTNSSQFFICTAKTEWLNGKYVVFSQMKDSIDVVTAMESCRSRNGKTSMKITITSLDHMANVFVYGTLKRGQPNHNVLLDGTNGCATFQGQGHTVEPYPLVIAGEHNIPHLLNLPGHGHCVVGEIYSVDEQMLHFLDEFEGCPDTYQRTQVRIVVLEWEGTHSTPKESPAAERTLHCFVYSTATYPPEWVHLPYHNNYDSWGTHGLRYNPRENR